MSSQLENERQALLERMSESRKDLRGRFVHKEEDEGTLSGIDVFPRSHTFKFITRHPYYTSVGLLAALTALPSGSLSKAVKGGVALTPGMLGSTARSLVMRQVLPSMLTSFRSRR
jgi:hypothetical protein